MNPCMKSESFCRRFACEHSFCSHRMALPEGSYSLRWALVIQLIKMIVTLRVSLCLMNLDGFWHIIPSHPNDASHVKTCPNMSKLFLEGKGRKETCSWGSVPWFPGRHQVKWILCRKSQSINVRACIYIIYIYTSLYWHIHMSIYNSSMFTHIYPKGSLL